MVINEAKKFIFVHVPKNAGTSLTQALGGQTNKDVWKHMEACQIKHWCNENYMDFGEYYKFAIVRNPWDRMVSFYHYTCQQEGISKRLQQTYIDMGFEEWLTTDHFYTKEGKIAPKDYVIPYQRRCQSNWLLDNNHRSIVNDVFKFEELDKAIPLLERKLQMKLNVPHVNKSDHRQYREYYSESSKRFIERFFEQDIIRFNYEY
jgi:hypothetical protein